MSRANLQNNKPFCQESIYNPLMVVYSPEDFAGWLESAFQQSHFKSYSAIAEKIGVSRAYVSSLAKARKQQLTDRPSQPKPEIVIKLAEILNKDVNEALILAGHAPIENQALHKPRNVAEFFDLIEKYGFSIPQFYDGYETLKKLDEDDLQELLESMLSLAEVKARKKT